MANVSLFGNIAGLAAPCPVFYIRKVLTNGTASPEPIFNANTPVPARGTANGLYRILGFRAYNNSGAGQAAATAQLQSNLNGLGLTNVSDLLDIQIQDAYAEATTISSVQGLLSSASATPDVLTIAKNAAGNAGLCHVLAEIR